MIDWLIDLLSVWLIDWLIDWLIGGLIDRLIDQLTDWLTDWLIDQVIDWLIDWLIDWTFHWLTDWSIEWLTDWLSHWSLTYIFTTRFLSFKLECHIWDHKISSLKNMRCENMRAFFSIRLMIIVSIVLQKIWRDCVYQRYPSNRIRPKPCKVLVGWSCFHTHHGKTRISQEELAFERSF